MLQATNPPPKSFSLILAFAHVLLILSVFLTTIILRKLMASGMTEITANQNALFLLVASLSIILGVFKLISLKTNDFSNSYFWDQFCYMGSMVSIAVFCSFLYFQVDFSREGILYDKAFLGLFSQAAIFNIAYLLVKIFSRNFYFLKNLFNQSENHL